MDQAIRRFWPIRRKSLNKSVRPEITEVAQLPALSGLEYNKAYETTVSGPPPEVGSLPIKPSDEAKPRKSFGHSKARSGGLQEFRAVVDKDAHSRATSTGIQPVLVGISRPAQSGSKSQNVMESGNNMGNLLPAPDASRPITAMSLPESRKAQKLQPTPKRHVDIMAFAAATGKYLEGYNEDVAERNLDLTAVANGSSTTTYEPKSRYQEEVATRNAAAAGYLYVKEAPRISVPIAGRSNTMHSRNITENEQVTARQQAYKHEERAVSSAEKTRAIQDPAAYHSRNGSATIKNSTPLPPISQELSVEDAERAIHGLENDLHTTAQDQSQNDLESERVPRYPSTQSKGVLMEIGQSSSYQPLLNLATRANEGRPIANGNARDHEHPLYSNPYEVPATHVTGSTVQRVDQITHQPTSRQTPNSSSQQYGDGSFRRLGKSSSRTSSADHVRPASSLSHSRDTSNRTFLDLTQDAPEPLSQVSSGSPNLDYLESPVVAQAKTDLLQVRRAHVVDSDSYNYRDVITPPDSTNKGFISTRNLQTREGHSNRWSEAFSDNGSFLAEQPLAFSGVTTVSSVSPASRPISKFSPAAESSRIARLREPTKQSSTSRRTPSSDTARPRATDEVKDSQHMTARSLDSRTKAPTFYVGTTPRTYGQPDSQPSHSAIQTPQVVYTSPESLSSSDFIDPSRAFGVTARDFASTPSRQSITRSHASRQRSEPYASEANRPPASRQDLVQKLSQEQKAAPRRHLGFEHKSNDAGSSITPLPAINSAQISSQFDHVDTPPKELTASSFDEAEFARKQAQARAAILRLQMSLEEQYDVSPGRPDSSAQRHIARQILDQTRKVNKEDFKVLNAPTSKYYERKEYQSKARTNRPAPLQTPSEEITTSGNIYDDQGPNSFQQSVHSSVTVPSTDTRPLANGYSKFSSAGSASHSYNYANSFGTNGNTRAPPNLSNPPLTPVLPSPSGTEVSGTEVSLSSFPMPRSPEQRGRKLVSEPERPRASRMNSQKSSVSTLASVYSIPHHMVPARDSSRRDHFEDD